MKLSIWVKGSPSEPGTTEPDKGTVSTFVYPLICYFESFDEMPFQIHPLREFLVSPALPPQLSRLDELAHNLLWTWDHNTRSLFRRLDPVLWKACKHNPVLMLGRLPQATLERAAADPRFVALYRRGCERFDSYLEKSGPDPEGRLIAYFSMEYGLNESLPIYSGGLGVLSGDHLKAASDGDIPLVAVGLLYQKGYLQQHLNPDGWQQERYPINDFYTWPVRPLLDSEGRDLFVTVRLPSGPVLIKVWRMQVGRVSLYLLDTNIPENENGDHRDITDQLYGGDIHTRIRQEIVLGIGGLRMLKAIGLNPTVYHMNEGHSAFLAVERIRWLMQEWQLTFEEALDASRNNNVFTTHTSVPAGIDLFDPGLMYDYFHEYCRDSGISFEQLLSLGRRSPHDMQERFSMAITAIKSSAYRNAVSRLHGKVTREMWGPIWPGLPDEQRPVRAITNGVHVPTWLSTELTHLFDDHLEADWRERHDDPALWTRILEIPDEELWAARSALRNFLFAFIRERARSRWKEEHVSAARVVAAGTLLDPSALTIGFARRFTAYKRPELIFHDPERLAGILTAARRPVQIVFAGKAHPADETGKHHLQQVYRRAIDPMFGGRIAFVDDYDLHVAHFLVQGCDVWMNNPRKPLEASGTSGMKASINGVPHFSIGDGWWAEGYTGDNGWLIESHPEGTGPEAADAADAAAMYDILERQIVPTFYERDAQGIPRRWLAYVRRAILSVTPRFSARRMVKEYAEEMYGPALKRREVEAR